MCLVRVFNFVKKAEQMYEVTIFKSGERILPFVWGVKRWEYREERRQRLKKSWSGGSEHSPKKLISEFNFITKVSSETSVCCLKSAPSTFQKMLFKHGFLSNNFQTTLFWTPWPNTFFQILDTNVQRLNTEHCVLKRQTKRPLNISVSHIIYIDIIFFEKNLFFLIKERTYYLWNPILYPKKKKAFGFWNLIKP